MKNIATSSILGLKRLAVLIVTIAVAVTIYEVLLRRVVHGNGLVISLLLLWLFSAYFVLPRIHRKLTKLYVPDYFIGRVRTADGLLADPVNLAFVGTKTNLKKAFVDAGWVIADPITLRSSWDIAVCSVLGKSYPSAPVSSLFLFSQKQDIAFQKEINGNPNARHHVRFWKTPAHWWLPGGTKVDWVGAATLDRSVGLSLFTGQITHKICENTDAERDFTWQSLAKEQVSAQNIPHFMTAYRSRSGGGDTIHTDGTLVIMSYNTKYRG